MLKEGKESAIRLLLDYRKNLMELAVDPSIYDDKKCEFPVVWVVKDKAIVTYNAALRAQRNEDWLIDGDRIYDPGYETKHPIESMTWEQAFKERNGREPSREEMWCVDKYISQKGGIMVYEKYSHHVPYYQRDAYHLNRASLRN